MGSGRLSLSVIMSAMPSHCEYKCFMCSCKEQGVWMVVCRGSRVRGSGWLHHKGAREEGRHRGAHGEVSAILSNRDRLLFGVGIILL